MRNYLLAAVATAALTSPAFARDDSVYVGVDAGVMLVEDTVLDYEDALVTIDNAADIDHKYGFDLGINAGYDFGLIRAEAELAYKQADIDSVQISSLLTGGVPATLPFDADGDVSVLSIMANALIDFGDDDGWNGFIGGGIGWASVDYDVSVPNPVGPVPFIDSSDSDTHLAWQILAGVRRSITPNLDLGLKYRYFNSGIMTLRSDPTLYSGNADRQVIGTTTVDQTIDATVVP